MMVNGPLPRLAIALTSASALSYEILLMKLFSIIQWHHFAYMIISLALLGYGMSGTFLTLFRERLVEHFQVVFTGSILLFAFTAPLCFFLAQSLPFNPLELLLDTKQLLWLGAIYLLLALPFFFAASAVGLAFVYYKDAVAHLYAADLIGAGIGSLGILALLYWFFPESALKIVSAAGVLAAAVALKELKVGDRRVLASLAVAVSALLLLSQSDTELRMNGYKDLSQTLRIQGAKVIDERSSPLGVLSVVENRSVPFRHAPGLSMEAGMEPPAQLGVFTNGDGLSTITRFTGSLEPLAYTDYQTSALPYHLGKIGSVLVIGAGGGSEVLQALYHGVDSIDAVEMNPQMIELVAERYAEYAGGIYAREEVTLHAAEARSFMAGTDSRYDLIQMAMVDSFGASAAGVQSLSENYLYTVEALRLYLERLNPGGYLAISRWMKLPPRDALKLVATALEALEQSGVENPQKQIALIRGWQTTTLVVKNGMIDADEVASLERFCESRYFDAAYYRGMEAASANRFNLMERPYFYEGTKAIAEGDEAFFENYKFMIEPSTDNRPYFNHFFKWETLRELLNLGSLGGMQMLEWGYLVLVASFLQAVAAAVVLILLPLLKLGVSASGIGVRKRRVFFYFLALGLGFLFIEIYFIQRAVLFLNHPLTAVAAVLGSFLVFAGLGSGFSRRLAAGKGNRAALYIAVSAVILFGLFYLFVMDGLFAALIHLTDVVKIMVTVLLIAPLAFAMGMPFPLGLSELGRNAPVLVPWAWGINGCASVISAVLATLVALHFGFVALMLAALVIYTVAVISFPVKAEV
jgi:spermidine synthase